MGNLSIATGMPVSGGEEGFLHKTSASTLGSLKSNLNATIDPTSLDGASSGYSIGSRWINVTTDKVFECVDSTVLAAVWKDLSSTSNPGGSSGQFQINNAGLFDGIAGSNFSLGVATLPALNITDLTPTRLVFADSAGRLSGVTGSTVNGANIGLVGTLDINMGFTPAQLNVKGSAYIASQVSNEGATWFTQAGTGGASLIDQYDGAGVLKNRFAANGNSYIQGGNFGVGISSTLFTGHFKGSTGIAITVLDANLGGSNTGLNLTTENGAVYGRIYLDGSGNTSISAIAGHFLTTSAGAGGMYMQADKVQFASTFATFPVNTAVTIFNWAAFEKLLVLRGQVSQSANLTEWQNSSGTAMTVINAAGNVGIGIATPAAKIHVHESSATANQILLSNSNGVTGDYSSIVSQYSSINTSYRSAIRFITVDASTNGGTIAFLTDNTSGTLTEGVRIDPAGNVGAGTGSTVSARIHSISTTEQFRAGYDTGSYFSLVTASGGATTFSINGVSAIKLDNSSTAGETRLQVFDVDTGVLKRVRSAVVPAAGSKLLYVDP